MNPDDFQTADEIFDYVYSSNPASIPLDLFMKYAELAGKEFSEMQSEAENLREVIDIIRKAIPYES